MRIPFTETFSIILDQESNAIHNCMQTLQAIKVKNKQTNKQNQNKKTKTKTKTKKQKTHTKLN